MAGSDATQLASGWIEHGGPAWSPDGKQIIFDALRDERWDTELINRLYAVDATGGEPRALTGTSGSYETPAFSPDGSRLAFRMYAEDGTYPHHTQLGVMSTGGSGEKLLTPSLDRPCAPYPDYRQPIWDGDRPVFTIADARNVAPHSLAAAGSDDEGGEAGGVTIINNGVRKHYPNPRGQSTWLRGWYGQGERPTRSHGFSYSDNRSSVQFQRMPNVSLQPGAKDLVWDDLIAATSSGALDWSNVADERKEKAYALGLAYAAKGDQAKLAEQIAALKAIPSMAAGSPLAELEGHLALLKDEVAPAFERFAKATSMRTEVTPGSPWERHCKRCSQPEVRL